MNVCKDCKYHRGLPLAAAHIGPVFAARFPLCVHPSRKTPDPVYGTRENNRNCQEARTDEKDCGPAGHMYEPSLRHKIANALFGSKADV
jgi:hypothetical protein